MGSSIPKYSKNHTINPETGYLESKAYVDSFDSDKKKIFLELYEKNITDLWLTCKQLHLDFGTVNKHYQIDPVFKRHMDEVEFRYAHKLQAVGRKNALNPRSVVERIWLQKSLSHLPGFEKYREQRGVIDQQININIDGKMIEAIKKREKIIDLEPIISTHEKIGKRADNQRLSSARNDSKSTENGANG